MVKPRHLEGKNLANHHKFANIFPFQIFPAYGTIVPLYLSCTVTNPSSTAYKTWQKATESFISLGDCMLQLCNSKDHFQFGSVWWIALAIVAK